MIAIVLGSGLNTLIDYVSIKRSIPYDSFIDFEIQPLVGHDRIIYEAHLEDQPIIILSGKLHLYEGYTYNQSVAPLRYALDRFQISHWIVTSACGSFNTNCKVGIWQKVSSIISLENIPGLWQKNNILNANIINGKTYAYQKGPSLGTVAEYKMLSSLGADLVGMSMLPESIYLNSMKRTHDLYSLPVCSYASLGYDIVEPSHKQVVEVANKGVFDLIGILKEKMYSQ